MPHPSSAPRGAFFPDGRLTTKEAWTLCQARCQQFNLTPPPLKTFKWYLQTGVLPSELVQNPFGNEPPKVYAIREADIRALIAEFQLRGVLAGPTTEPEVAPTAGAVGKRTPEDLSVEEAHAYLCRHSKGPARLSLSNFREYLEFDVLPRVQGPKQEQRVRIQDLDAFLELFPSGIFANHVHYDVGTFADLLSMQAAYEYYASKDPYPVTKKAFRSLVDAAIILPVRTSDDVHSPLLGIRKKTLDNFLAIQGHQSPVADEPEPARVSVISAVFDSEIKRQSATMLERGVSVGASKPPLQIVPPPVPIPEPEAPEPGRWEPVKEAYTYYHERAVLPKTFSWFRAQCGDPNPPFRLKTVPSKGPAGKKYLVDLASLDQYLEAQAEDQTSPVASSPVTPPPIPRQSVNHAYAYYCTRVQDPVAEEHFQRLITTGRVQGAVRGASGWFVSPKTIDAFVDQFSHKKRDTARRVQLSRRNYANTKLFDEAVADLIRQGFEVDVAP